MIGWDKSIEGKKARELFRETKRNLTNIMELLLNKVTQLSRFLKLFVLTQQTCNILILNKLYNITHWSLLREYILANQNYMDLSIGNAPWPIGVTMVGIHERSGRAKIFTSEIARKHVNLTPVPNFIDIMNDESQKRYVQAFKRLLTICQKHRPTDLTKMVLN